MSGLASCRHTTLSELAALRQSQRNLPGDADQVKTVDEAKSDLRDEIADLMNQLRSERTSSPCTGARIKADTECLEADLEKHTALTVAPTGHLPCGMVARIALASWEALLRTTFALSRAGAGDAKRFELGSASALLQLCVPAPPRPSWEHRLR